MANAASAERFPVTIENAGFTFCVTGDKCELTETYFAGHPTYGQLVLSVALDLRAAASGECDAAAAQRAPAQRVCDVDARVLHAVAKYLFLKHAYLSMGAELVSKRRARAPPGASPCDAPRGVFFPLRADDVDFGALVSVHEHTWRAKKGQKRAAAEAAFEAAFQRAWRAANNDALQSGIQFTLKHENSERVVFERTAPLFKLDWVCMKRTGSGAASDSVTAARGVLIVTYAHGVGDGTSAYPIAHDALTALNAALREKWRGEAAPRDSAKAKRSKRKGKRGGGASATAAASLSSSSFLDAVEPRTQPCTQFESFFSSNEKLSAARAAWAAAEGERSGDDAAALRTAPPMPKTPLLARGIAKLIQWPMQREMLADKKTVFPHNYPDPPHVDRMVWSSRPIDADTFRASVLAACKAHAIGPQALFTALVAFVVSAADAKHASGGTFKGRKVEQILPIAVRNGYAAPRASPAAPDCVPQPDDIVYTPAMAMCNVKVKPTLTFWAVAQRFHKLLHAAARPSKLSTPLVIFAPMINRFPDLAANTKTRAMVADMELINLGRNPFSVADSAAAPLRTDALYFSQHGPGAMLSSLGYIWPIEVNNRVTFGMQYFPVLFDDARAQEFLDEFQVLVESVATFDENMRVQDFLEGIESGVYKLTVVKDGK